MINYEKACIFTAGYFFFKWQHNYRLSPKGEDSYDLVHVCVFVTKISQSVKQILMKLEEINHRVSSQLAINFSSIFHVKENITQ